MSIPARVLEVAAHTDPIVALCADLTIDERIGLYSSLALQEICLLPVAERLGTLEQLIDLLPSMFAATQGGMREGLVGRIRRGE